MISYDEALVQFNDLLNDDFNFMEQWGYKNKTKQQKAFFEWCSLYEDTKHLKSEKEVNE